MDQTTTIFIISILTTFVGFFQSYGFYTMFKTSKTNFEKRMTFIFMINSFALAIIGIAINFKLITFNF